MKVSQKRCKTIKYNQKNQNISCVSDLDIKLSGPEMVILSMPINISSFFDHT